MFKTSFIENFYNSFLKKYFSSNDLQYFKSLLSSIDMNIDIYQSLFFEYYVQDRIYTLNNTNFTLQFYWNVSQIFNSNHEDLVCQKSTSELLQLLPLSIQRNKEVFDIVNINGPIKHKRDKIVLGKLFETDDYSVIDGNHRVFEKYNSPNFMFNCIIIDERYCPNYLFPASFKLLAALDEIFYTPFSKK